MRLVPSFVSLFHSFFFLFFFYFFFNPRAFPRGGTSKIPSPLVPLALACRVADRVATIPVIPM